jgi:hypothetical protein
MHPHITHPGKFPSHLILALGNKEIPQMGDQSQPDVMSTDRSGLDNRENAKRHLPMGVGAPAEWRSGMHRLLSSHRLTGGA